MLPMIADSIGNTLNESYRLATSTTGCGRAGEYTGRPRLLASHDAGASLVLPRTRLKRTECSNIMYIFRTLIWWSQGESNPRLQPFCQEFLGLSEQLNRIATF